MLFSEVFKEFYFTTHHFISAVYLFFGLDGHDALVRWIWTSIGLHIFATLVLAINPGKNNPRVLLPAAGLFFIAIWMEKGIGLIVPGLIPSPLGEVVDYLPSWVELCVTLGVLCLGLSVVTFLIRAALIIEQRYEHGHSTNCNRQRFEHLPVGRVVFLNLPRPCLLVHYSF